jgi:hypothetical protein
MGRDGEDVYFVAPGKLAEGTPQEPVTAAPGGETNLYQLHGTTTTFIARLSLSASSQEILNWLPTSKEGGVSATRTSRVSADGGTLLFRSSRRLTAYRNHGVFELYLFRTGQGIDCISCNPTGQAPAGPAGIQDPPPIVSQERKYVIMTRNLSANGRRVIFDSSDRLVKADENMDQDVYEWEEKGEGSCESEAQDGGCLFLISGGAKEAGPSYFADADEEGENVFFLTAQQMVAKDRDSLVDLYDARVGGGIAAQAEEPPQPCEGEAGCLSSTSSPPSPVSPSTSTFSGAGNATPPSSKSCSKGKVRKNGKCVAKPKHKRQSKKKHHKKKHHGQTGVQGKGGGR